MILENTIKQASQLLKNHNIISSELDAEIILSNIMKVTREFLIVNNHVNISKKSKIIDIIYKSKIEHIVIIFKFIIEFFS